MGSWIEDIKKEFKTDIEIALETTKDITPIELRCNVVRVILFTLMNRYEFISKLAIDLKKNKTRKEVI